MTQGGFRVGRKRGGFFVEGVEWRCDDVRAARREGDGEAGSRRRGKCSEAGIEVEEN